MTKPSERSSSEHSSTDPLILDPATVASVIDHMNSDHADACLSIARAFCEQGASVVDAQMIDLDARGLLLRVRTHAEMINDQDVRVDFTKALRSETQIRGAVVGLTRQAREKLANL